MSTNITTEKTLKKGGISRPPSTSLLMKEKTPSVEGKNQRNDNVNMTNEGNTGRKTKNKEYRIKNRVITITANNLKIIKRATLIEICNEAGIAVRENEMVPSIVGKLLKMQKKVDKLGQELASLIFKTRYPMTVKESENHINTPKNNCDKAKAELAEIPSYQEVMEVTERLMIKVDDLEKKVDESTRLTQSLAMKNTESVRISTPKNPTQKKIILRARQTSDRAKIKIPIIEEESEKDLNSHKSNDDYSSEEEEKSYDESDDSMSSDGRSARHKTSKSSKSRIPKFIGSLFSKKKGSILSHIKKVGLHIEAERINKSMLRIFLIMSLEDDIIDILGRSLDEAGSFSNLKKLLIRPFDGSFKIKDPGLKLDDVRFDVSNDMILQLSSICDMIDEAFQNEREKEKHNLKKHYIKNALCSINRSNTYVKACNDTRSKRFRRDVNSSSNLPDEKEVKKDIQCFGCKELGHCKNNCHKNNHVNTIREYVTLQNDSLSYINVQHGPVCLKALVDTGANVNVLSEPKAQIMELKCKF
uniref:Peptidase A2 domain-containing protein n=1 Tax=Strongyloides papillosus TaxID=174720 RepID=A0A0N5BIJ5_STREA